MSNYKFALVVVSSVFTLTACAQQAEILPVVHPEPIFDKLGQPSGCASGYELDSSQQRCLPIPERQPERPDDDTPRDPGRTPEPDLPDPQ